MFFQAAGQNILMLNDPEAIKQVLVTEAKNTTKSIGYQRFRIIVGNGLLVSEGDFWLRQRRFLAWAFSQKNIDKIHPLLSEQTINYIKNWQNQDKINLSEELNLLTLQIISTSLLGINQEKSGKEIRECLGEMIKYLQTTRHIIINFFLLPVPKKWKDQLSLKIEMSLPFASTKRFKHSIKKMNDIVFNMIEERRRHNDNSNLLDALINARDDVDNSQMTDQQIKDETINMIIAGHETTANALTWTWIQILKHPQVYQKIKEEVKQHIHNDIPSMSEVTLLKYTKAVIEESIRLYPPFWRISRANTTPMKIKGYDIPKSTSIITSIYTVQRKESLWNDPLAFKPERFIEDRDKITPFSYFPFGGGPRVCIGANFSMIEAQTIIACMVKHFDFESLGNLDPEYIISLTLQPKGGCPVKVSANGKFNL